MRASIGRCRLSGNLCRITVNMKFIYHSDRRFSVKISVSDTGVGCKPQEFYGADKCSGVWPAVQSDWNGELYVTSTCKCGFDSFLIYHSPNVCYNRYVLSNVYYKSLFVLI
ncbi:hypothetical protein ZOSMA_214G00350 [Zostera marina]|uniref:Uncharacterized protein n=1 Tax=Zostera marina TaxID=29655 RepID=A0A0K9PMI7_ZOSMR|nr:hypothetical protein ZOSMA_214G00350 [Zostera marina]